jgi:hypothetical protein
MFKGTLNPITLCLQGTFTLPCDSIGTLRGFLLVLQHALTLRPILAHQRYTEPCIYIRGGACPHTRSTQTTGLPNSVAKTVAYSVLVVVQ